MDKAEALDIRNPHLDLTKGINMISVFSLSKTKAANKTAIDNLSDEKELNPNILK